MIQLVRRMGTWGPASCALPSRESCPHSWFYALLSWLQFNRSKARQRAWERHLGLGHCQHPPQREEHQPALEIPSARPWEQADGSSPMALNALCSQSRSDRPRTHSETSLCSSLKTVFFSLRSRPGATTHLDFAFLGVFLPNYSALLHRKVPASASFHLDNNFSQCQKHPPIMLKEKRWVRAMPASPEDYTSYPR